MQNFSAIGVYHHLRGYFAVDALATGKNEKESLASDLGLASMEHGSPQSHQILFAARVVPIGKPEKVDPAKQAAAQDRRKKKSPSVTEVQHYAVDYAIAGPQLRFVQQSELWHGSLDFMISAFDDDGKALTRLASRTTADLKPASYKDVMIGGFRLRQEFDVPATASFLRLGVEDELSRNLGTVEIPLPVPPPADDPTLRAHVLPPIEPN